MTTRDVPLFLLYWLLKYQARNVECTLSVCFDCVPQKRTLGIVHMFKSLTKEILLGETDKGMRKAGQKKWKKQARL